MSLNAARILALRAIRPAVNVGARRNVQMVPHYGSQEAMRAEQIEQLAARVAAQKARSKGHSHEEEVEEVWKWLKISAVVALPLCILSSMKDILFEEHAHRHEGEENDYMKIRSSPFPWECEDCDLLDRPCWKKCRAEKEAEAA
eukprot:CAMPEP_0195511466 /NCGR_PEP_ID=MMETSP0794_2-20130614/3770_1 /TAXON_ID=515487 /ORGANISM="Stephanopyxis turris, Strain CCMP 815" /LENGTH=143 /DNA_ID=CAMNT_0040639061 /DNA_START=75 /DNA_END=506 /DNA_ORIENTATION=+